MSDGIVYQNKDIEFKLLSETYKENSFEAYGLKLPRIKQVLPTNLPSVAANEKHMDNLFLLEDGTLAAVDYESEDSIKNRIKYVNYIGRVMERFYRDTKKIPDIRLIKKESDQIFVLTGLLVSTDKFISEESAGIIRRLLDMTKVGRMLYEEGMEEGMEKGMEEGRNRTLQLVGRIFTILKDEPALTNKEIADKLYCDENEVDTIRKMYP